MVERLQETLKGATFVDLDGTLITENSMRIFMRKLPGILLKRKAPGAAIAALWWIWLRAMRITSHRNMKWHLTRLGRRHLGESDWESIAEQITLALDPDVSNFIETRKKLGCLIYIATAAPEEYSVPLCRILGYDGVIATIFSENPGEYEEMKGYAKHDSIEHLLADAHLRLESFLTDHPDDIPTASAYPGLTIIVHPTKKTAEQFHEVGVSRYLH
ncbi:MAG: haloacid dehalogenase-like hydrolase [Muribaculaceae bacterium]|nr:haloacid dehalogenase-like hydrolase [Muribaculaceae bacterium]